MTEVRKMTETVTTLKGIVQNAILSFNRSERYLIRNDMSERCICARFAMHLTEALKGTEYSDCLVDVEYNRGMDGHERAAKRIENAPITVDLIVHKRGMHCRWGFDNLICIEMKKTTDRRGYKDDEARLMAMTDSAHGFHYKLGVMLAVNMTENRLRIKSLITGGQIVKEYDPVMQVLKHHPDEDMLKQTSRDV